MNDELEGLKLRYEKITQRIYCSALESGRNPDELKLIVVTKGKSAAVIKNLIDLGASSIGESYLNEALFKQDLLRDYEIDWHMLGNIQLGKAKQIIYNFNTVHSVDRLSLARELQEKAHQISKKVDVYLEINVSGESTKHGWLIQDETIFPEFNQDLDQILEMSALSIKGLMTMAPYSTDPEISRPYFRKLRKIRDLMITRYPNENISGLSMGMSNDFEVAIQEGATILRIGTAIVGDR